MGKRSPLTPKDEAGNYTDLQVCRSNAGYYIGTMFVGDDGFIEPGSRDSGYYRTKEEAETALQSCSWEQREHP